MTDQAPSASPSNVEAAAQVAMLDFRKMYAQHLDRGAVLAQVADLDVALRESLEARFRKDAKTRDEMFSQYGPLGNTKAKVQLSYLLSILKEPDYQDALRICTIRNRFAHHADAKDCEHPSVAGQIDNLTMIRRMDAMKPDEAYPADVNSLFESPFSTRLARGGIDVTKRNFRVAVTIFMLIAFAKAG